MAKQSIKIKVDGRAHRVSVYSVGQCFGTEASVKIGATRYESGVKPFGMSGPALDKLLELVQRDHPAATLVLAESRPYHVRRAARPRARTIRLAKVES